MRYERVTEDESVAEERVDKGAVAHQSDESRLFVLHSDGLASHRDEIQKAASNGISILRASVRECLDWLPGEAGTGGEHENSDAGGKSSVVEVDDERAYILHEARLKSNCGIAPRCDEEHARTDDLRRSSCQASDSGFIGLVILVCCSDENNAPKADDEGEDFEARHSFTEECPVHKVRPERSHVENDLKYHERHQRNSKREASIAYGTHQASKSQDPSLRLFHSKSLA